MLRELAPDWQRAAGELLQHDAACDSTTDGEGAEVPGVQRFSALAGQRRSATTRASPPPRPALTADDPINIQFTSGTTGFPKGATLTHRNILNNGFFIGECMKLTPADRLCIPVPLYHCFGMVLGNLACLTHGATIVYPNDGFDPITVLRDRRRPRNAPACTACRRCSSPSSTIRASRSSTCRRLRTGIMAGSPCPIEVMKRVVDQMHLREITIAYGMTETSPVSCQSGADDAARASACPPSARVQPHLEVKIVDPETGRDRRRAATSGEFCTRGYSVMHGYWGDDGEDARGDRRRGLDAHRRPRDHGRRGLRATSSGASRTW